MKKNWGGWHDCRQPTGHCHGFGQSKPAALHSLSLFLSLFLPVSLTSYVDVFDAIERNTYADKELLNDA
jgi:hypothetical protein